MGDVNKEEFYVVRKGDIIGIYKSFSDCIAQAASSPLDPSISVYKGYGLSKEAEAFVASHGLKQASFSIGASYVQDGIFGTLTVCPFQDVVGSNSMSVNQADKFKIFMEAHASAPVTSGVPSVSERFQKQKSTGSTSHGAVIQNRAGGSNMDVHQPVHNSCQSCTIEFDGASKGNPGLSGAGAVLRATDGSEVWRLREGVGIATNNVAEYRSVILGLRTALQKGFKHVRVQGDSLLVCNQIQGKWKTKNENMANLCEKALELKKQFASFIIEQVPREFNSDADAQANRAINLRDGQVEMDVTR
ncbi:hypothetical protein vseg_015030 [Gypsophila vaccaria]